MLYLDENFIAHTDQDALCSLMPWEDTGHFFDGKCQAFIEGHRVVPEGYDWERPDGITFHGLMISPVVDLQQIQSVQIECDKQTIADLDAAVVDLTYQNILMEMEV
jgi:hypothetical protein